MFVHVLFARFPPRVARGSSARKCASNIQRVYWLGLSCTFLDFRLGLDELSIESSKTEKNQNRFNFRTKFAYQTANTMWRVICILFENRPEKQSFGASVSLLQPSIHDFLEVSQHCFGGASFADSWSFRAYSTCLNQPPDINLTSDKRGASSERTRNLTNCKTNYLTRISSLF